MQIGDIAKVVHPGAVYSTYEAYIEHYCPDLHSRFYYGATHVKKNDEVRVLCTGKHLRDGRDVCVVESCDETNDWVQIIGVNGLDFLMCDPAPYEIDVSSEELMKLFG